MNPLSNSLAPLGVVIVQGIQVVRLDTFTAVDGTYLRNHAPEIGGSNWIESNGYQGAAIYSGRAVRVDGDGYDIHYQDPAQSDLTITADVRLVDTGAVGLVGISFRDQNGTGIYGTCFYVRVDTGNQLTLTEYDAGAGTPRGSATVTTGFGFSGTLTIVASGSNITVTLGSGTITYNSAGKATYTKTAVVLYSHGSVNGNGDAVDNFKITKP